VLRTAGRARPFQFAARAFAAGVCYLLAMRLSAALAFVLALLAAPALAQQACAPPLAPMLKVELYFGFGIEGRRPVSDREWARFVAQELTPHFPGLTVLDARGAWRKGQHEMREHSKLVVVVTKDGAVTHNQIAEVTDAYKRRFHQASVGIVTQPVCAAF
jgi:hypothetical protein